MNKQKVMKEKILEALEGDKEFEISWGEKIFYSVKIKAKNEEEARDKFYNGDVVGTPNDIVDSDIVEDSLEIAEVDS